MDVRYRSTPSIASTVLISIGFLAGGYATIATASILAWAGMAGVVVAATAGFGTAVAVPLGLGYATRSLQNVIRGEFTITHGSRATVGGSETTDRESTTTDRKVGVSLRGSRTDRHGRAVETDRRDRVVVFDDDSTAPSHLEGSDTSGRAET